MEARQLADHIVAVAHAHEASFVQDPNPKEHPLGDYTKTIHQCATELVPTPFDQLVYLMLTNSWNDARDWAIAQGAVEPKL